MSEEIEKIAKSFAVNSGDDATYSADDDYAEVVFDCLTAVTNLQSKEIGDVAETQKELTELRERIKNFDKFGDMTTPIGLLPINTEGMRKLVDAYSELRQKAVMAFAKKLKEWLNGCELYFYNGVEEACWSSDEVRDEIDNIAANIIENG